MNSSAWWTPAVRSFVHSFNKKKKNKKRRSYFWELKQKGDRHHQLLFSLSPPQTLVCIPLPKNSRVEIRCAPVRASEQTVGLSVGDAPKQRKTTTTTTEGGGGEGRKRNLKKKKKKSSEIEWGRNASLPLPLRCAFHCALDCNRLARPKGGRNETEGRDGRTLI